jgi:hypothetical protein
MVIFQTTPSGWRPERANEKKKEEHPMDKFTPNAPRAKDPKVPVIL